jgi:hypothetical protein
MEICLTRQELLVSHLLSNRVDLLPHYGAKTAPAQGFFSYSQTTARFQKNQSKKAFIANS